MEKNHILLKLNLKIVFTDATKKASDKWIHRKDLFKTVIMQANLDCGGQQNVRQVCVLFAAE